MANEPQLPAPSKLAQAMRVPGRIKKITDPLEVWLDPFSVAMINKNRVLVMPQF